MQRTEPRDAASTQDAGQLCSISSWPPGSDACRMAKQCDVEE